MNAYYWIKPTIPALERLREEMGEHEVVEISVKATTRGNRAVADVFRANGYGPVPYEAALKLFDADELAQVLAAPPQVEADFGLRGDGPGQEDQS